MVNKNDYSPDMLVSTSEVAKLLGISRVSVFKRIQAGKIKAKKIGRNYVIRYGDLIGELRDEDKDRIDLAVRKAVAQYGETFKLLAKD